MNYTEEELNELIDHLHFFPSFGVLLKNIKIPLSDEKLDYFVNGLTSDRYDDFYKELDKLVDGKIFLKIVLISSLKTLQMYDKRGISRDIFYASISCTTRFVNEHYESYGDYDFDRGFWVGRQLSLNYFRIGELEFELSHDEQMNKEIVMHIPSDAKLSKESIDSSLKNLQILLKDQFPEYAGKRICCCSWLLSPQLKLLLKKDSNILLLQRYFELRSTYTSDAIMQWVFKNPNLKLEDCPENTSLQRNLKKFLLEGNKFEDGFGVIMPS